MIKDQKVLLKELVDQVGKPEARRLLVGEGVSVSTATKLISERYKSEISLLLKRAVLRALDIAKKQAS